MNLDRYDLEILKQLDCDARASYSKIGKKIRKSKQFVGYRINNLKKEGIITSYILDVSIRELGYTLFNIFLQFQKVNQKKESEIMNYLKKSKYVGYCLKTLGNWDLFISVKSKGVNDFYNFLKNLHKYSESIKKELINLEVRGINTNLKFLDTKNLFTTHIFINDNIPKCKLNPFEKKVINELKENPLMPYLMLAEKTGKVYDTVKKTIKELKKKKIIKRTRAIINNEKIGYSRYLFLVELSSQGNKILNEIMDYAKKHRNIDYIIECLGTWNFIFNVYSKDTSELIGIINGFKEKFSKSILSIEFLKVISSEKESFSV